MKLDPGQYGTGRPSRARCDALTARLTGAPAPSLADLQGAALAALRGAGAPFLTLRTGKPHLRADPQGHPMARVSVATGAAPGGRPWLALSYQGPGGPFDWLSWAQVPTAGLTPGEVAQALGDVNQWLARR